MLSEISAKQFTEWEAFDLINPIGNVRGDHQAALISATIANANRNPKRKNKPFENSDFMLKFVSSKEHSEFKAKRSYEEMKENARAWTELINRKQKTNDSNS